jgi:hypothetical protein
MGIDEQRKYISDKHDHDFRPIRYRTRGMNRGRKMSLGVALKTVMNGSTMASMMRDLPE